MFWSLATNVYGQLCESSASAVARAVDAEKCDSSDLAYCK